MTDFRSVVGTCVRPRNVIGNLMTYKLYLSILFLLFSLKSFGQPTNKYSVEVIYWDFISRPYVHYYLTENKIELEKYFKLDSVNRNTINHKTFNVRSLDSLENYLNSIDWSSHKSRSDRYCIDGYFYSVKITIDNKTHYFEVDCLGDSVLNKLVDICNFSIPNAKYRDKYKLGLERKNYR